MCLCLVFEMIVDFASKRVSDCGFFFVSMFMNFISGSFVKWLVLFMQILLSRVLLVLWNRRHWTFIIINIVIFFGFSFLIIWIDCCIQNKIRIRLLIVFYPFLRLLIDGYADCMSKESINIRSLDKIDLFLKFYVGLSLLLLASNLCHSWIPSWNVLL